jgi:hypothetical protein
MARRRMPATVRRAKDDPARTIANGVYSVTRDLAGETHIRHVPIRLPLPMAGPLVYICEMIATVVGRQRGLPRERADELALYLFQGSQETMVVLLESFDETHFEAWVAAAKLREVL